MNHDQQRTDVGRPVSEAPPPSPPRLETGVPGVGARRRRRGKAALLWVVAVAVVALIGAAIGVTMFANRLLAEHRQKAEEARAARLKASASADIANRNFEDEKKRIKERELSVAQSVAGAEGALPAPAGAKSADSGTPIPAAQVSVPPVALANSGSGGMPVTLKSGGASDSWYSGVLLKSGDGARQQDSTEKAVQNLMKRAADTPASPLLASGSRNALDEQLSPSSTARAPIVKATLLPDLSLLLKRGTLIPCVGPKIVTTYPGMLSCSLMQDVYSADGKTLLLRKGATALGEQRTALMQGQTRIFALWTEIDDGQVTVNLDSPATDPLGGSGIEAWTDNHFWARFGGAIMVSLIGDAGQALSNLTTRNSGGTTISLSSTSGAAQQVAAETLKNTINVAPTAYANQGTVIYIYVARHVDFRSVYELASG